MPSNYLPETMDYMDTKAKCRHLKNINLERDFAAGVYLSL